MADLLTVVTAFAAFLAGPPFLASCADHADRCDRAGDTLGAFAWTLAGVLGAYGVGLAFLVLVIMAARS
ncbi:hypothetical protein NET02_09315 [Thermomicrobiaceae bacterium CFH 74404]|uniref:Uncharacterized protein n=2 Tax=Thermomicrobia TaxID=189775 RepID=A0AA42BD19_9BACT|nr:hypothetical protein [Thermalbibacter longus]MCM8749343.1 hypothetical protein [Thermalbibacter longus]